MYFPNNSLRLKVAVMFQNFLKEDILLHINWALSKHTLLNTVYPWPWLHYLRPPATQLRLPGHVFDQYNSMVKWKIEWRQKGMLCFYDELSKPLLFLVQILIFTLQTYLLWCTQKPLRHVSSRWLSGLFLKSAHQIPGRFCILKFQ